jgi:hypothetical protein
MVPKNDSPAWGSGAFSATDWPCLSIACRVAQFSAVNDHACASLWAVPLLLVVFEVLQQFAFYALVAKPQRRSHRLLRYYIVQRRAGVGITERLVDAAVPDGAALLRSNRGSSRGYRRRGIFGHCPKGGLQGTEQLRILQARMSATSTEVVRDFIDRLAFQERHDCSPHNRFCILSHETGLYAEVSGMSRACRMELPAAIWSH